MPWNPWRVLQIQGCAKINFDIFMRSCDPAYSLANIYVYLFVEMIVYFLLAVRYKLLSIQLLLS